MRSHAGSLGERLETDVALERLDPRVNPHVRRQRATLSKRLQANRTFVRFLSAVYQNMFSEGRDQGKPLPARFTLKWSLASVLAHVNLQVGSGYVTLSADFTHARFVTSVVPHMNNHTVGMSKCFSANLTWIGFGTRVRVFMPFQPLTTA